jgi:hypothetical protein
MAYYADQMRKGLTGRAGDWLARHSWPHLTMILAFILSAWAAYLCSNYIVGWGGFSFRFSVNFVAGYAVFVSCLGLWLWTKPSLDRSALLDGAPELIETQDPWDNEAIESRQRLIDDSMRTAEREARGDGLQGLIGLAVVTMVLGTLFVAMHMMWYARWYLGHLLVLGGKVRHRALTDVSAVPWLTAPVRLTFWAAVILLVHYALLGLLLQWAFPQAVTVSDIGRR